MKKTRRRAGLQVALLGLAGLLWFGSMLAWAEKPPISFRVEPLKLSYSPREGIRLAFILKARQATSLCLEQNPLAQFAPTVYRLGEGKLPIAPLVIQDTREFYRDKMRFIQLKPGQSYVYRLDLRQYPLAEGRLWQPGEYSVTVKFFLCNQTSAKAEAIADSAAEEDVIHSENIGRFFIMY